MKHLRKETGRNEKMSMDLCFDSSSIKLKQNVAHPQPSSPTSTLLAAWLLDLVNLPELVQVDPNFEVVDGRTNLQRNPPRCQLADGNRKRDIWKVNGYHLHSQKNNEQILKETTKWLLDCSFVLRFLRFFTRVFAPPPAHLLGKGADKARSWHGIRRIARIV